MKSSFIQFNRNFKKENGCHSGINSMLFVAKLNMYNFKDRYKKLVFFFYLEMFFNNIRIYCRNICICVQHSEPSLFELIKSKQFLKIFHAKHFFYFILVQ